MKVAVNAWFLDAVTTGSGQYTRNMLQALQEVASDAQFELVEPRNRSSDLAKVQFEQIAFPRAAKRMNADIARLTNQPVRFLVNTHWHPDHVSGNSLYREQWPGVAIVGTPGTLLD